MTKVFCDDNYCKWNKDYLCTLNEITLRRNRGGNQDESTINKCENYELRSNNE